MVSVCLLTAILAKLKGGSTYLISNDSFLQAFIRLGIQVIRPDKNTLFASWQGERADASHYITDHLSRFEDMHEPLVLSLEPGVKVYFGIVEFKNAIFLAHFHVHIIRAVENFVIKSSEFRTCSH